MTFWSDQPIARNKPDQHLSYLSLIKLKSSDLKWFETSRTKESEKLITKKGVHRLRWEIDCVCVYVLDLGLFIFFLPTGGNKKAKMKFSSR